MSTSLTTPSPRSPWLGRLLRFTEVPTNRAADRRLLEPGYFEDPYAHYARLREESPVYWSWKQHRWVVTTYPEVKAVLADPERFSSRVGGRAFQPLYRPFMGRFSRELLRMMMFMDRPDHERARRLLAPAFGPAAMRAVEPSIRSILADLLDDIAAKGSSDLVSDLAYPLPALVIAELMGSPREDRAFLRQVTNDWVMGMSVLDSPVALYRCLRALDRLRAYFLELIARKRRAPADDVVTLLVAACDRGELTEDELVAHCILVLITGHETTQNLIGTGAWLLASHPEALALVREDPDGHFPSAIEEILRYQSPAQVLMRIAREDVDVGGHRVAAGEALIAVVGSANRDPSVFAEPDRFDVLRRPNPHLSFGAGPHACVAARLGRLEGRIALQALFERFGDLRVLDGARWRPSYNFRGPLQLPVRVLTTARSRAGSRG